MLERPKSESGSVINVPDHFSLTKRQNFWRSAPVDQLFQMCVAPETVAHSQSSHGESEALVVTAGLLCAASHDLFLQCPGRMLGRLCDPSSISGQGPDTLGRKNRLARSILAKYSNNNMSPAVAGSPLDATTAQCGLVEQRYVYMHLLYQTWPQPSYTVHSTLVVGQFNWAGFLRELCRPRTSLYVRRVRIIINLVP